MRIVQAFSERRLLFRIHVWLLTGYILSLIVFEAVLGSATYAVMKHNLMSSAYSTVRQEWSHKAGDAIKQLSGQSISSDALDTQPEMVVTWVVNMNGVILVKDLQLVSVPGKLNSVLDPVANQVPRLPADTWVIRRVRGNQVLIGEHPLAHAGTRVGGLVSAYSLEPTVDALADLIHVDLVIGLGSLPFVVLIAMWLVTRSSRPIRNAMRRQREFVNDAAHELRTPLSIVRGNLELATVDGGAVEIKQAAEASIQEIDYIVQQVSDMSMLARLQSGAFTVDIGPADLAAILSQTLERVKPLAEAKQLKLVRVGCNQPHFVQGDLGRLRQLFLILIQNAIKYNRQLGRVEVVLQVHRHAITVDIIDTGIGISEVDLPHVFDRFYRSQSGRGYTDGSGLGLAIAASIVELHHGRIAIKSKFDEGTTVRVTFS